MTETQYIEMIESQQKLISVLQETTKVMKEHLQHKDEIIQLLKENHAIDLKMVTLPSLN
jgi:hypothetical protein